MIEESAQTPTEGEIKVSPEGVIDSLMRQVAERSLTIAKAEALLADQSKTIETLMGELQKAHREIELLSGKEEEKSA